MKLTDEIKQKIIDEFNQWKDIQYGDLTKFERDELGAFFTPPEITIQMIESFSCDSLAGKTILDPTIGAGGLIAACIIAGADPKLCYGNEYNPTILEICKKRLCAMGVPEINLHLGDATNPDCIKPESFIDTYKWDPTSNTVTGIAGTQIELW